MWSAASSPVEFEAEPQTLPILLHFKMKRKHLVLYKSVVVGRIEINEKKYNTVYFVFTFQEDTPLTLIKKYHNGMATMMDHDGS